MKIRIDKSEHLKHPWKVHDLLTDFEIEDVWHIPVELEASHSLKLFHEQFRQATKELTIKGPAGWLFQFRFFLGKIFKWEREIKHETLRPGSLRERYAMSEGLSFKDFPSPGNLSFIPVYEFVDESLAEIENATVHGAIHFGRISCKKNIFTITMTVYVKPKEFLGRIYMLIIKPFRLFIVYPTMMRMVKSNWEKYLESES